MPPYREAVALAREEAKEIAAILNGVETALADAAIDITDVEIHTTTIVYKRAGKTFHLVVHAMIALVLILAACGDNEPPPSCVELQCTPTCDENPCLHRECVCTCTPAGSDAPTECLFEHQIIHHP